MPSYLETNSKAILTYLNEYYFIYQGNLGIQNYWGFEHKYHVFN